MAKKLSFIGDTDRCFICKTNYNLEKHHIMNGPFKKASEKYGLLIKVCPNCHTMAANSIHRDSLLRKRLKQVGQEYFEQSHSREEFIKIFDKNYL
jgi:hypothetical protein